MKKNIKITLLPHQKQLLKSKKSYVAMICGRGAGKTYAASLLCAICALSGDRILVGAQNYKALSINLFNEITKRLDEIIGFNNYHYNRGQTIIEIPMSRGVIYGFTYENIDSCRRIY